MIDAGLADWVAEACAPLGIISRRRMFGGATIHCDGIAFAILAEGVLWFKADAVSDTAWDAIGAERFTVTRSNGAVQAINYARAPDAVYDDADAMRDWAVLAITAARRALGKARPERGEGRLP